jgi:uncharacterized protein
VQVVVAIFPSLEGESLEDVSIRLAERWRVGQKGLDNGAIFVVFVRERRVRLEVGYGLEASVPDLVAGQIIREQMAPRFREGRYAAGLEAGVRAVYQRVEAKPAAARRAPGPSRLLPLALLLVVAVIIGFVVMNQLPHLRANRRGYTAGHGGWSVPPVGPWWGGGSGRGGGFGGGGFGGGGFSGGGGGFGGGGASGEW